MALSLCKPPRPVSFTGNVVHNWQGFEEQLTWFLAGTELSEKSDSVKIGIMLMHTGKEAWEYFPGLNLMTKWNSTRLSKPSGNTANHVRTFFMKGINSAILNKPVDVYSTRLKVQIDHCDYERGLARNSQNWNDEINLCLGFKMAILRTSYEFVEQTCWTGPMDRIFKTTHQRDDKCFQ